jgi:menaquinone-dependent protoporphyrinogen IX oxidase/uncharacterized protein YndB with AHSA1/START domain
MQHQLPLALATSVTAIAAHTVARRLGRTWGATPDEARMPLPGDDLVPTPDQEMTMAVSIDAPADRVWPWLTQMGVDRAGLYTHTWVENGLLRLGVHNADRIDPAWQDLEVGDHLWFVPEGYPTPRYGPRVVEIDPPHHLVCVLGDDPGGRIGTWQFVLQSRGDTTRLIHRSRSSPTRPRGLKVMDALLEPGYQYMTAGMLRGIADRATGDPLALPPVAESPVPASSGSPLRALVAVASPQGATLQIARAIASELRLAGIAADLRDVREVTGIDGYDAVVVGSAIHSHHWLSSATAFLDQHRDALRSRPTSLFSSGMLAIDSGAAWPEPYPREIAALMDTAGARDHRIFAGRRAQPEPRALWNLISKGIVWYAVRAGLAEKGYRMQTGDYRDWDAIHAWARGIANGIGAGVRRSAA